MKRHEGYLFAYALSRRNPDFTKPIQFGFPVPFHWHECPGIKVNNSKIKDHRKHLYPCHNPKCKSDLKRYCGFIVDALCTKFRGNLSKAFNKKYL